MNANMTRRNEDGAALLMVLIFITALALVIAAVTDMQTAHFKVTSTVTKRADMQYAADGGIEAGIQALRAEMVAPTRCLTPLSTEADLVPAGFALNGRAVTVKCKNLRGFADTGPTTSPYGFALITTDPASSNSVIRDSGSDEVKVRGSMYIAGDIETNNGNDQWQKFIRLENGEAGQLASNCPTDRLLGDPDGQRLPKDDGLLRTSAPYPMNQTCTAFTPEQIAPNRSLPLAVPTAPHEPIDIVTGAITCRVFYPGKYAPGVDYAGTATPTDPVGILKGNNEGNYFTSGVYYFEDTDLEVDNGHDLVAGEKSPANALTGDLGDQGVNGCANDVAAIGQLAAADQAAMDTLVTSETGAWWVLGGDSNISIKGTFVMNTGTTLTSALTKPQMSLQTVRTTGSGWKEWGSSDPVILNSDPSMQMVLNGYVYVWNAPIQLFTSQGSVAAARAGVVARFVDLQASNAGTDKLVITAFGGGDPTLSDRTIRITSTAKGVSGGTDTTVNTAIVTIGNASPYTANVLSWRTS